MKTNPFYVASLMLLFATSLLASDTQVGGIWYEFNNNYYSKTAAVTYRGSSYDSYLNEYTGVVVIPESVTYNNVTYSVTSIGEEAFRSCRGLTSVTIPNSVTSIGSSAFYWCTSLTSVTIGNSVTSIGDYAFAYCFSLTSVTIGNRVTSIGMSAFIGCTGLTSVIIPNSVTSIGDYAFRYCSGLTSVTIPNSVTSIGREAFRECSSLTSVTIPNSVTSIGSNAFYRCTVLTSIDVVSDNSNYCSVDGVLFNKDKTTLIQYPGGKQGAYTIPNSVTRIGYSAFRECSSLTSVTIPNSVTSIGNYAFRGCTGLTSVTIPNSVTSIGYEAFRECSSLTSVTIPNSVTYIGSSAFYNCSGFTAITCEALNPPTLGSSVFYEVNKSIPLYVPAESITAYKTADQWKDFRKILPSPQGMEEIVENSSQEGKFIHNGQIFILRGEKEYSITGQEVQ